MEREGQVFSIVRCAEGEAHDSSRQGDEINHQIESHPYPPESTQVGEHHVDTLLVLHLVHDVKKLCFIVSTNSDKAADSGAEELMDRATDDTVEALGFDHGRQAVRDTPSTQGKCNKHGNSHPPIHNNQDDGYRESSENPKRHEVVHKCVD